VPDNLGLLFRRNLVMFGPREQLLTSQEPVVRQFLNGRREGPIGMSEEKDVAQVEAEMAALEARGGDQHHGVGPKGATGGEAVPPQLEPTEGLPERKAVRRRQERVAQMLHEFDEDTQEAIRATLPEDLLQKADAGVYGDTTDSRGRHWAPDGVAGDRAATATLPRQGEREWEGSRE
jgi:phospholipid/cholesterol/gamma-HCH transport system ATP-binding protein